MATFLLAKRFGDCIYQILVATSLLPERECDFVEDRISGLPDELILSILSCMGMKDAAKTSILSKKWRYHWTKRVHLDFDHSLVLQNHDPDLDMRFLTFAEKDFDICSFTVSEKDKYINWVNQVLGLHCAQCIDTFRVCFLCDSNDFDKWVRFALSRKVKKLELYAPPFGEVVYNLGLDILTSSLGFGITSLTSLHLNNVDVTGDFIKLLLSKCHNLENLYVASASFLVKFKDTGVCCKFMKQPAIRYCKKLEELEIDTASPLSIYHKTPHIAAHIDKLSVQMLRCWFPAGRYPTFCNLKHLSMVIKVDLAVPANITPLLEACPVLHEFKLEMYWPFSYNLDLEARLPESHTGSDFDAYLDYSEFGPPEGKTHPSLKLLQIGAYCGCRPDVCIILYMVRFACNLETIICDPNSNFALFFSEYSVERSRARALKLKKIIPPKISVIII